jgi:hypothetical protein
MWLGIERDVVWAPRHTAGAGILALLVLLVVLWAMMAHAGELEDKLLARGIIAENWPELVGACSLGLTLQAQPEWDCRQMGRCAPAVSTARNFTSS